MTAEKKTDEPKPETRTIAVAGFPYRAIATDPLTGEKVVIHKFAVRGDTVELLDPADVTRGENAGAFGEPPKLPRPLSINEMDLMTDDQLYDMFSEDPLPPVKDVLDGVGQDAELAKRVLAAEAGTGREPRKGIVEPLEKVIEAREWVGD